MGGSLLKMLKFLPGLPIFEVTAVRENENVDPGGVHSQLSDN